MIEATIEALAGWVWPMMITLVVFAIVKITGNEPK